MTEEQIEAIIWLMMEYRSTRDGLNVNGFSELMSLREEWNIEKAEETLLKGVEE